ncbi:uncharacterized protein SPPG_07373 [Spizellomyces punctatus DAOM BR117]|uniref:Altered inheritance of mitochondria protein 5, mitochondrial n=1 Tax=Spizellomyces punctatus (strain DAOM BR117) TaxID=645134 RepID=A0A0L0H8A4_SPIPD|nr:uncharacterized protein SPPG_07373 [Spizellomyces punctatus DAOM BR117]KNC97452.1 hypothetical protein SPPG_07373 [Spizellomyces punctatus DAOM BR117]|eukprot:XP_016605492.1 hypothetical protein SPPG_07373 [Spizellomyces punctatus DAOM BR117]
MPFFLPLTSGLLACATLYHLISSRIEEDTRYARTSFRQMQRTVEENLPVEIQDQSLFVPSSLSPRAPSPYALVYQRNPDSNVSFFGKAISVPDWRRKSSEAKENWNRQIRALAEKCTGQF